VVPPHPPPILHAAVGVKITGVDNDTYSITGESFSHIALANTASSTPRKLQEDDVALAYEFSRKFPGYTADNLTEKGIHEVKQRRFCLVSADHPIVSAISENSERLQMGDISMMPEGMIKIGSDLYNTILPMVQQQVASQIKVRDLSAAKLTISPADATSWSEARTEMISEAKSLLRSSLETELSAAAGSQLDEIRERYNKKEARLEHDIDSRVYTPRAFTHAY
jgi:hypothetical protein